MHHDSQAYRLSIVLGDYYVAAKATYIRLLHGKIGILEGFFGPIAPYTWVGPIKCLDEICSVHPHLRTLKIWGGGLLPAELGGRVCLFFFMSPLRRHIFVSFMAKSAFFSALAPYTGVGPI